MGEGEFPKPGLGCSLPFRLSLCLWHALFLSVLDVGRKPWLCSKKRKPLSSISSMATAKPGCTEEMYPEAFHKAIMGTYFWVSKGSKMGYKLPFPISPRAVVHGLFSALTALLPPFLAATSKSPRSKTPPHPQDPPLSGCKSLY